MLSHLNVGCGEDISILELAAMVSETVGYEGDIILDRSKPDGTMRKLMDSTRIHSVGWRATVDLRSGLQKAYEDFQKKTVTRT